MGRSFRQPAVSAAKEAPGSWASLMLAPTGVPLALDGARGTKAAHTIPESGVQVAAQAGTPVVRAFLGQAVARCRNAGVSGVYLGGCEVY